MNLKTGLSSYVSLATEIASVYHLEEGGKSLLNEAAELIWHDVLSFFLFVFCFVNVFLFCFFLFCFTSNLNVNKSVHFPPSSSKQLFTAASSTEISVPSYSVPCLLLEPVLFASDAPQKKQNCSVCYLLMCQLKITH